MGALMTMRRVLAFSVFWMALWTAPVVGQEVLSDEVAQLRMDLMVQRGATIQARSDRLAVERQFLDLEITYFREDQASLQVLLDEYCGSPYDMATRTCTDVLDVDPEPPVSEEDDPS